LQLCVRIFASFCAPTFCKFAVELLRLCVRLFANFCAPNVFERYFRFCGRLLTFLDFVTAFLRSEALIFARLGATIIP
jgi:hypothetical protein